MAFQEAVRNFSGQQSLLDHLQEGWFLFQRLAVVIVKQKKSSEEVSSFSFLLTSILHIDIQKKIFHRRLGLVEGKGRESLS